MIGYSFLALSMPLAAPPSPAAVSFGFMAGVIAGAGKAIPFEGGATGSLSAGGAVGALTGGGATGALTAGGATGTLSTGGATGTLTEDVC